MANKQINEYTLKVEPVGTDQLIIQESGGTTKRITLDGAHHSKVGFFDYNDLATATVPITHNGVEGYKKLPNDGAGAFTNLAYKPLGMTTLWNTTTGQFDFSELSLGDMVNLRADITVTTTSPNQVVDCRLELGIGSSPYALHIVTLNVKTATTQQMVAFTGFYMGDTNTLNFPAEFQMDSDDNATFTINGWYLQVIKA